MAGWRGNFREDWTGDGFFGFQSTGVQYAANGVYGLRHSIYFDQGPWLLQVPLGTATGGQVFDQATSRIADSIVPTSVVAGAGSYFLYRRMRLPRDFGSWSVLSMFTQKFGSATDFTSATLTMYRNGVADGTLNGMSIMPVTTGDWEQMNETPSSVYFPGDFITLAVNLQAKAANGAQFYIADFGATYVTARGNV